jgi:acetyl esterase/lipase
MSFTKACALMIDLAWLPVAAVSTFYSALIKSVDPIHPKIGHPAILLLHGSGGNHGTLALGVHRLKKQFPNSIFTIQYDGIFKTDRTKTIDQYVKVLKAKCLEIIQRTQQNQIYLVGHSMGGLISARFAQTEAESCGIVVPAVITIGSPWRGSHLINKIWSPGKAWTNRHEDMRPESKFVSELNTELPHNSTRFHCIGSLSDLLVPFEQAIPKGRDPEHEDNLCLNGIGHYTLIVYPLVWEHVEEVLVKHIRAKHIRPQINHPNSERQFEPVVPDLGSIVESPAAPVLTS